MNLRWLPFFRYERIEMSVDFTPLIAAIQALEAKLPDPATVGALAQANSDLDDARAKVAELTAQINALLNPTPPA